MFKASSHSFYRITSIFVTVCLLSYLTGCATMNQAECQSANWEVIGFKDGASGKPQSFISKHQSACSEFGVKADLNTYLEGHERGVYQYCTYERGYQLAESGNRTNENCSHPKYKGFASGFNLGKKAYSYKSKVIQFERALTDTEASIASVDEQIEHKEKLLLGNIADKKIKRDLLEEIKALTREREDLLEELPELEFELLNAQQQYEKFKRQNGR